MKEDREPLISKTGDRELVKGGGNEGRLDSTSSDGAVTLSASKKVGLAILLVIGHIVWGSLISLQPPFYPQEAEKKGATPSQVSVLQNTFLHTGPLHTFLNYSINFRDDQYHYFWESS